MTWALAVQLLVALGAGGCLVAIINAIVNRKKVAADTKNVEADSTKTIFEINTKHISDQDARMEKLEKRITDLETEKTSLEANFWKLRTYSYQQSEWSVRVYALLTNEQKTAVGAPPQNLLEQTKTP